ncbi:Endonuclease/exonuclease/phosphatase [Lophiotrema nucula]|uniref:Endonuclease/exonuclease/phosphatase n=1 Tax=Lophiotrema nucula TaxID=690887 RepID=A0A6A5Z024_9PLEO|nr:Endonuclease/exonuclease/phosphatase [Lophiotrema nucula]
MLSRLRTCALSWWHETTLPPVTSADEAPVFQEWHQHHQDHWTPFLNEDQGSSVQHRWGGALHIVTWNVDAGAPSPAARLSALLCAVEDIHPPVDIMFLQEVSKPALKTLLAHPWIRQRWLSSEADDSKFRRQSFATVTLIARSCLSKNSMSLGRIWRVPLPSRFERDALCCDLLVNKTSSRSKNLCIRLINVHLDSLPINPSRRPLQVSIVASYLHAAGHGLIAGDFNPVLPEDAELVSQNNLVDAWSQVHPTTPGYTWGVNGKQMFPPSRLDKIPVHELEVQNMRVLPACEENDGQNKYLAGRRADNLHFDGQFSDHLGLSCVFYWKGK